jgi:toxin ParE1/3/4
MKVTILWSDAALAEMLAIFELIMESSPQGALLVDDRVNEQIELLKDFPLAGKAGRNPGTRELVIDNAACVVVYRIEDDDVRILSVIYGGQKRSNDL